MTYHGGPVETGPVVNWLILWEPYGAGVDPTTAQLAERLLGDIGDTPLFGIANQYMNASATRPANGAAYGNILGGVWIDTSPYSSPESPMDVASVASHQRVLHGVSAGPNHNFFVVTTASFRGDSNFSGACGWHSSFVDTTGAVTQFSWIGTGINGCSWLAPTPSGSASADGVASVISHELMETVTDPTGQGWFYQDGSGEIGDLCSWQPAPQSSNGEDVILRGNPYVLQTEWDNASGGCQISATRPVPRISTISLAAAPVGQAYIAKLAAAGGIQPYQWSLLRPPFGASPLGLMISSSTGTLSGAISAAGNYVVTVQVTDAAGRNATQTYALRVGPGVP